MAISSLPSARTEDTDEGIVAEINITPLTDVFLVLLIIFMITSSVISQQGKQVNLPEGQVSDTTPEGVTVTLTAEGSIQVNERVVSQAELPAALKAAIEASRDKTVVLRGDRQVILGQAVYVLDQAQLAGATGFALATQKPR
ncbi:MAG TPA: biopolymer transporter ExbD, partial [Myxococcota bacterium]|nr:biopolymer transporter ExbD [Myxococcota bacterium]